MFKRILKRGLEIEKENPIKGIYRIKGEMYDMQVVVINQLENEEVLYPFAPFISKKAGEIKAFLRLIKEHLKDPDDPDIKHVTEFTIVNGIVKPEELKEVTEMIGNLNETEKKKYVVALKGTWFENQIKEEGREKGREEEREQTILKQYKKDYTIEQIADINDFDIEYVKKVIRNIKQQV